MALSAERERRTESVFHMLLSQLAERENLKKSVSSQKRKNFPTNPTSLDNFDKRHSNFQMTGAGDKFLVYDSRDHNDLENGRMRIFSTRRNLEILSTCGTWFLGGTFKVSLLYVCSF